MLGGEAEQSCGARQACEAAGVHDESRAGAPRGRELHLVKGQVDSRSLARAIGYASERKHLLDMARTNAHERFVSRKRLQRRDRAILESLTSIRRAGADFVLTYFARDAAKLLG